MRTEDVTPTMSRMVSQPRRFNPKTLKNRGLVRFDPGRYIVTEEDKEVSCLKVQKFQFK